MVVRANCEFVCANSEISKSWLNHTSWSYAPTVNSYLRTVKFLVIVGITLRGRVLGL